jgi:hypothetical protein
LGEGERTSRPEFTGVAVVILLGGTVGVPAKSTSKSVVGAIVGTDVGLLTGMSVGRLDGDITGAFDRLSTGAGVAGTSGSSEGIAVVGDLVGKLFGVSVGLRVGDDAGTFDIPSIGALVWDWPVVGGGSVGELVTLLLGDTTGKLVGLPIDDGALVGGDTNGIAVGPPVAMPSGTFEGPFVIGPSGFSSPVGPTGGDGTVGAFVSVPLGVAPGLVVGPPVDTFPGALVGIFPDSSVGLRDGDEAGPIDKISTGAGVPSPVGPTGGDGTVGAFVSLPLGDAPGLEVGLPVDKLTGALVGVFSDSSVGLRDGDAAGPIGRNTTGAGVPSPVGPTGGDGIVGAFVSLPFGGPPTGDCVGLFVGMSVGLREGDEAGAIDRTSTGTGVPSPAGPTGGDGIVGAFVSLPFGDPPTGDCVGLFVGMSVGLREGDEAGAMGRLSTGVSVSGSSGYTVSKEG